MKYGAEHIKKLTDGVLPFLKPAFTMQRTSKVMSGNDLILSGVYVAPDGKMVSRGKNYTIVDETPVEINHTNKIRQIIDRAKSESQMIDRLGAYVARYGYQPGEKKE